jgi:heat shock protein HslJ
VVEMGRRWLLREVHTGSTVVLLSEQSSASITFETDGRVRGDDGQNLFQGLYRFNASQGTLRADQVMSTMRALVDKTDEQRLVIAATHSVFATSGPPIEVGDDDGRLELRTHEHVLVYA